MQVRLRVTHCNGSGRPREIPLTLSESCIDIGRALTSDLCLEDPERIVSGLHARIHTRDDRIWLTDLSRNGTHLNGASDPIPVRCPVELHDGDRIGIGPYEVLVLLGASSSVPPAKPRRHLEEPRTEALSRFDPRPDSTPESATAVWSPPELPTTVSDTLVMGDPCAATARLDVTAAGVMPAEVDSATTLVQGPPMDETQPCIPSLPSLDEGATAAMPASIRTDAWAMDAEVRAARRALLALLEPAALERRFVGVPSSDLGLSVEDKARCWDGFRAIHRRLVAESMTDGLSGGDDASDRDAPERPR